MDEYIDVKIFLDVNNLLDLFLDGLDVILFRDSSTRERSRGSS